MTTSDRPIASITRKPGKEVYWDLQVDDTHNYVTVDGAIHHNSTKTTAGIYKIAYEAAKVAKSTDGLRRSRYAWIRNTRQQLFDTSIPDFLKAFPDGMAGTFYKSDMKFVLEFDDIYCEVLFRGLDDANDVRRLLSLQLTGAIIEEFRECNPEIFETLQGRVGRYPDGMLVPHRPEWGEDFKGNPIQGCVDDFGAPVDKIWLMSNPPDADTYWEEHISNPTDNMHVTIQPSGLSEEADWIHLLKSGYYENLAIGKTEDWIDVYIHAKFGKSLSGKPVFRCFNRDTHVAKEPINHYTNAPLIIGVDAGLNPSAVICQSTYDGRLLVLDSVTGSDGGMGALRFIREILKPLLTNKYPGMQAGVIIDPAAFQRAQTDERCVADMFKQEGFLVKPAITNAITARLGAVENYLTRMVEGKPAMLVDPEAGLIIQALAGKYRYKVNTKGVTDDKPEKSHPYSDVCFVAGTLVTTPSGAVPVDHLRPGDVVLGWDGPDEVVCTGSRVAHDLVELVLSDGTTLVCTADHPFAVNTHTRFLPADALQYEHELLSVEDNVWVKGRNPTRASIQLASSALTAVLHLKRQLGAWLRAKGGIARRLVALWAGAVATELLSTGVGSPGPGRIATIGTSALTKPVCLCTGMFGKNTAAPYQRGMLSTTLTTTRRTTRWGISRWSRRNSTPGTIWRSVSAKARWTLTLLWRKLGLQRQIGTGPKPGANGIDSTLQSQQLALRTFALFAANRMNESGVSTSGTTAPLRVIKSSYVGSGRVFNLTTSRSHTYYAGGALVHNCDALQYACLHANGGEILGRAMAREPRAQRTVSLSGWV